MIRFQCPSCRAKYRVSEKHRGKTAKCRECGHTTRIPGLIDAEDSDEFDLADTGEHLPPVVRRRAKRKTPKRAAESRDSGVNFGKWITIASVPIVLLIIWLCLPVIRPVVRKLESESSKAFELAKNSAEIELAREPIPEEADGTRWFDGSRKQNLEDLQVTVRCVAVGPVKIRRFGVKAQYTNQDFLKVFLVVENQSLTQWYSYTGWGSMAVPQQRASFRDARGERYLYRNFPDPVIRQVTKPVSLGPGQKFTELLVFKKPDWVPKNLTLTLPGDGCGMPQDFRILLPVTPTEDTYVPTEPTEPLEEADLTKEWFRQQKDL